MNHSEEVAKKINSISKTYCPTKWQHATVNFEFEAVKSCCHHDLRPWNKNNLHHEIQFHDTHNDTKERTEMLDNIRPENCRYCWWIEDSNQTSDRILWAEKPWIFPFINNYTGIKNPNLKNPSWLEISFTNACNLKCSYCSPLFSSSWSNEIEKLGPYPTLVPYNCFDSLIGFKKEKNRNSEMKDTFWKWFQKIYFDLFFLKLTGGEPLLSNDTFKMLDWIQDNPNPNLVLTVNSNLCIDEVNWDKFLAKVNKLIENNCIKTFSLHPSIDSIGEHASYIRNGLNFSLFKRNLEKFLSETSGQVAIICTLNNLSLFKFNELLQYVLLLKKTYGPQYKLVTLKIKPLLDPSWQSINILPKNNIKYLKRALIFTKENIGARYTHFEQADVNSIERAIALFQKKLTSNQLKRNQIDFYLFFREHDKRRNTNIIKIFPELWWFWLKCYILTFFKKFIVKPQ